MRQLAEELHLTYSLRDEFNDLSLLREFRCYQHTPRNRKARHLLQLQEGLLQNQLLIFDLEWRVSNGKSGRTYTQTMFFLQSKQLALPDFALQPENWLHRIGAWLGLQDINLEAYPEFSRHNVLRGDDPELVRDMVVQPPFARLFQINREWHVEGMGYYLVLYKQKRLLAPDDIKELIVRGMDVFGILRQDKS